MSKEVNNPHDKYVKSVLTNKKYAINFLKNYLPERLVKRIDFSHFSIEKDSHITDNLKEYFSDLIFKTKINDKKSQIYFLFEHKSSPDSFIFGQLMKYIGLIWTKSKNKPIVIPYVFYNGKEKWNSSLYSLDHIQKSDNYIERFIPKFKHLLCDLNDYDRLLGDDEVKLMISLLKFFHNEELVKKSFRKINIRGIDDKLVISSIFYIMNSVNVNNEKKFLNQVQDIIGDDKMPTIAQELKKQGERESKIKVAKRLLRMNLSIKKISKATDLDISEVKKIKETESNYNNNNN